MLLEFATLNVIARNDSRGGRGVMTGKDADGNWIAANGPSEPAFPGRIPADRLKLLDELLQRDAKNMRGWAAFKKLLRAPN